MVFALHSKVIQNLAAVVEFVHSIIKTLNCRASPPQGVCMPVITVLGVVGNTLSIVVLHTSGLDMKVGSMIMLHKVTNTQP